MEPDRLHYGFLKRPHRISGRRLTPDIAKSFARMTLWVMLAGLAFAARADGFADFENFNEGFNQRPSLTDPKSGIVFSEPTSAGGDFNSTRPLLRSTLNTASDRE